MRGSRIMGLGHFVPSRVVTNAELATILTTSDEWIQQRTGIKERRWVDGDVGASELAEPAARQAIKNAGLEVSDIDLIVFATLSPDVFFPGSSCLLQDRLGLNGCAALDIRTQCTGFLYALSIADAHIRSGLAEHVLVVGAEVHSSGLDMSDRGRDVTVIFGDGAGAAVVGPSDGTSRILGHKLHADGKHAEILKIEAPASRRNPRITHEMISQGLHYPHMQGRAVFKLAVSLVPKVIIELLEEHDLKIDQVDLLVPHQANQRINEMVARRLEIDPERVYNNIERFGNTTAASIPIALHEAVLRQKVKPGGLVCLAALGAGMTWGATLIRW